MSTTRITATAGRLLTCAALALGLTGLSQTVARAHDTEGTKTDRRGDPWAGQDRSPCTNEWIDLTGRETNTFKQRESGGKIYMKSTSQESGTGTGIWGGSPTIPPDPPFTFNSNRYKYSNFNENEFRSSTCRVTIKSENIKYITKTNRPDGRRDDYFLHFMDTQVFDTGVNGCRIIRVDHVKIKSRCK